MLRLRVDVERVRRSFIALLIDLLVHLTFDTSPFSWTQILKVALARLCGDLAAVLYFERIDVGHRVLNIDEFLRRARRLEARQLIQHLLVYRSERTSR